MRITPITAAVLLAASSAALAQPTPAETPPVETSPVETAPTRTTPSRTTLNPVATRRGWEVGAQIAGYQYEEPDFAKLTGVRIGPVGAYTFKPRDSDFFIRIDGRLSLASLRYESNGTGSQDNVPDYIIEARSLFGLDFFPGSRVALSPYLGLGYRYLYDDLQGYSSTGAAGYRRESNYVYAPVGLTARFAVGSGGWVLAPNVEADIFIIGKQKSHLSDTKIAGLNDVSNTQKHGYGYRASFMIEKGHIAFGPWFHYWHIQDSDLQPIGNGQVGLEPENWTLEGGLEFRWRF